MPFISEPEAANLTVGGHRKKALGGAGLVRGMDSGLGATPTVFVSRQACTQCGGQQGATAGKSYMVNSIVKV